LICIVISASLELQLKFDDIIDWEIVTPFK
jgi:hypothetical protein